MGVAPPRALPDSDTLDELGRLLETAGGDEVARLRVIRERPDPATFIGAGKVQLLAQEVRRLQPDYLLEPTDPAGQEVFAALLAEEAEKQAAEKGSGISLGRVGLAAGTGAGALIIWLLLGGGGGAEPASEGDIEGVVQLP